MVAREGEHVLVLADAADKGRLGALVRVSDAAVTKVARMWPTGWRRKVVVVAVRDQRLVETYFRTALQSSDKVAAIAVPAFDTVPGWTPDDATTYDQKTTAKVRSRVILNPRYFQPTNKDNAQLLTHEVTHVATQAAHLAGGADLAAGGHRRLHGLPRPAAVRGHPAEVVARAGRRRVGRAADVRLLPARRRGPLPGGIPRLCLRLGPVRRGHPAPLVRPAGDDAARDPDRRADPEGDQEGARAVDQPAVPRGGGLRRGHRALAPVERHPLQHRDDLSRARAWPGSCRPGRPRRAGRRPRARCAAPRRAPPRGSRRPGRAPARRRC